MSAGVDNLVNLNDADDLAPIPAVALKLFEECRKAAPDLCRVMELIECEPAVAAKVLSVANSPLYGCAREIDTVQRATVVLGARTISGIAISYSAKEVFESGERNGAKQSLLEHSLGTAVIAKQIASKEMVCNPSSAFLAGIMHDIGKLVFLNVAPEKYLSQQHSAGSNSARTEDDTFGVNHAQIGHRYVSNMGLPPEISKAVADHHSANLKPDSLEGIANIANRLAKEWGLGSKPNSTTSSSDESPAPSADGFDSSIYEPLRETSHNEFEALKCIFQS